MRQESAASARSCDSELGELAVSAGAVLRSMGRCALWVLIACELAAQAALSALVVALSPLLRGISVTSARMPVCFAHTQRTRAQDQCAPARVPWRSQGRLI